MSDELGKGVRFELKLVNTNAVGGDATSRPSTPALPELGAVELLVINGHIQQLVSTYGCTRSFSFSTLNYPISSG